MLPHTILSGIPACFDCFPWSRGYEPAAVRDKKETLTGMDKSIPSLWGDKHPAVKGLQPPEHHAGKFHLDHKTTPPEHHAGKFHSDHKTTQNENTQHIHVLLRRVFISRSPAHRCGCAGDERLGGRGSSGRPSDNPPEFPGQRKGKCS